MTERRFDDDIVDRLNASAGKNVFPANVPAEELDRRFLAADVPYIAAHSARMRARAEDNRLALADEVEQLPSDALVLMTAAAFAAEAHKGQVRKELNEPYIIHPLRVAKLATELNAPTYVVAALLLHDVVEDTPIPLMTIRTLFGEDVATLVHALTKPWRDGHTPSDVDKQGYYARILSTPWGAFGKVLDRIDNLYDFIKMAKLSISTHRWAKNYAVKTRKEFGPIIHVIDDMRVVKRFTQALEALEEATS